MNNNTQFFLGREIIRNVIPNNMESHDKKHNFFSECEEINIQDKATVFGSIKSDEDEKFIKNFKKIEATFLSDWEAKEFHSRIQINEI